MISDAVDLSARNRKREPSLSVDGKWRSFPKVPNLLQYVSTETYYARTKVNGKIVRQSLQTDVWSTAKLRLIDFLKEQKSKRDTPAISFSMALSLYEKSLATDTSIKPRTVEYRQLCISKIKQTWPRLLETNLSEITEAACRDWASDLSKNISSRYFNNTIATLRLIIAAGIKEYVRLGGNLLENPAQHLSRVRVDQKELRLPEPSQFHELIADIRSKSGVWSPDVADLVEFLSYSGMRAFSEAGHFTWEDVDWKRKELIIRGDPETKTKNGEIRRVPMLPNMENLLARRKAECEAEGKITTGKVVNVTECRGTLARACKAIGISKLTHHDLRHLFATRCIESGVDIPTVSRWLGHKDGGALAMKTYGHLRNEHSREMAAKVRF